MTGTRLLEAEGLAKHFKLRPASLLGTTRLVKAVDGVSFHVDAGETLGLVGESGSGKSTIARLLMRLVPASGGAVRWRGEDVLALPADRFKALRRDMQMIFQDPLSSLNPSYTVGESIEEPMIVHGAPPDRTSRRARVRELMEQVGLDGSQAAKYPHEFSGGQRQRIGIARALAVDAKLIIADEPVSSLDVSIQAQVLNLMQDLKDRYGLSYLFIAHDLAVVKHMSRRVAVLYLGRLVETATSAEIYRRPAHPYTRMLLQAIPRARVPTPGTPRTPPATGEIPSPIDPPGGCPFHTRCPLAETRCRRDVPAFREIAPGHHAACHLV
ncbi:MAG: ATP-binding cassette domain-containing protein [Alphaproteobacteria bacterium]|nr:ATP-binding cassette domain-containing protein [Alphaproteobacteria bacterium]